MSSKADYLARADEAAALAESCSDTQVKRALKRAEYAWRLLADIEANCTPAPPTRWPVGRKSAFDQDLSET
jgi:hypothetical protein